MLCWYEQCSPGLFLIKTVDNVTLIYSGHPLSYTALSLAILQGMPPKQRKQGCLQNEDLRPKTQKRRPKNKDPKTTGVFIL